MTAPPIEVVDDVTVLPIAQAFVDCLCVEIDASPGGMPCFCGLLPGANVALDCDCDAGGRCGTAWVRIDQVFPSARFPVPLLDANNCAVGLAVRLQVGVVRCTPVGEPDGLPPSVEAQAEAVRVQLGDLSAARRAIQCCVQDHPAVKHRKVMLGQWTPVGPAGGCAGGIWSVTVQVI